MSFTIHSPENRKTIHWASGTSTEMFIHPSDGNFADRSFQFRISSATVEAEESTFTFFEGITRHLMILKGELELIHEGRYTKRMKTYDQDTFSGEWDTRSKGRVTDFNLMLKGTAKGSLMHQYLHPKDAATVLNAERDFLFVYIDRGSFKLNDGSLAKSGDLIEVAKGTSLHLNGQGDIVEINVTLDGAE